MHSQSPTLRPGSVNPSGQSSQSLVDKNALKALVHQIEGQGLKGAAAARAALESLNPEQQKSLFDFLTQQLSPLPRGLAQLVEKAGVNPKTLEAMLARYVQQKGGPQTAPSDGLDAPDNESWQQFLDQTLSLPKGPEGKRTLLSDPRQTVFSKDVLGLPPSAFAKASPSQRMAWLSAVFGADVAELMMAFGLDDPTQLLEHGLSLPGRSLLGKQLGLSKAKLMLTLWRGALTRIDRGPAGELALSPQWLETLAGMGIISPHLLATLRAMTRAQWRRFVKAFQTHAMTKGISSRSKFPVSRDFRYWAKQAGRLPLFGGSDDVQHPDYAEEQITAWLMEREGLALFEELMEREQDDEQREREQRDQEQEDRDPQEDWVLEPDKPRADGLVCFWASSYDLWSKGAGSVSRAYICMNPETGEIIPQGIESTDGGLDDPSNRPDRIENIAPARTKPVG